MKKKKLLSLLIVLAMIAATVVLPTAVFADGHTHTKGTEYMTDGRAHWLACDNADGLCDLETVEDYEIAFSSYEGPELKEALNYVGEDEVVDSMLMGRQGKVNDGVVSKTDGRTIIGLTQDDLDNIGSKLIIVGCDDSDNNKQVSVEVDCAYTWFYNGEDKIEAGVSEGVENCAAFVIIDSELANDTITGYGYYRVYNDTVSDSTLLGEALYVAPRTFKAVYDTNGGANTLNFYYDTEDHSGENKTVYENTAENPTGLFDSQTNNPTKWGYHDNRNNIKDVSISPTVIKYKGLIDTSYMFQGFTFANSFSGAEYLDVSSVTTMLGMFTDFGMNESSINEVPDVERWNTSSVTSMQSMFYRYGKNSQNLNFALDLSGWDVSKVSYAKDAFTETANTSKKFSVTIPHYTKGLEGTKPNTQGRWYTKDANTFFTPLKAGTNGQNFIVAQ